MPFEVEYEVLRNVTWYIDGSAYINDTPELLRCRFSIVMVSEDDQVVGVAVGVRPCHVDNSAGAELWAFMCVLATVGTFPDFDVPSVVRDCEGIVAGLGAGRVDCVAPKSMLVRIWVEVYDLLGDRFEQAKEKVVWMTSHAE